MTCCRVLPCSGGRLEWYPWVAVWPATITNIGYSFCISPALRRPRAWPPLAVELLFQLLLSNPRPSPPNHLVYEVPERPFNRAKTREISNTGAKALACWGDSGLPSIGKCVLISTRRCAHVKSRSLKDLVAARVRGTRIRTVGGKINSFLHAPYE